ncbi:transmembrane 9 superfamily member 2-like [Protopterus annectens]|uniref:transmembrane 9 superfamily member 2-like n=1 Tax=Protopterus annectens TaxID=7888 RepID=UPI001CFAB764|nr:transmembrane 9 superfamily member 2-like [Protopterus annectens]
MYQTALGLVLLLCLVSAVALTYIILSLKVPLSAPVTFCKDAHADMCDNKIRFYVNSLDSVESALSYDYSAFEFCHAKGVNRTRKNLGQVLSGDRTEPSPYVFEFKKDEYCQPVCAVTYTSKEKQKFAFLKKAMLLNYRHHWIIDGVPVLWCSWTDMKNGMKYCYPGFPFGCYITEEGHRRGACVLYNFLNENTFYVFNHVDVTIFHTVVRNETDEFFSRVINVTVEPKSVRYRKTLPLTCDGPPLEISNKMTEQVDIMYSYSVKFVEEKELPKVSQWDYILKSIPRTFAYWGGLINSLVITLILSAIMIRIMVQTLQKDTAPCSKINSPGVTSAAGISYQQHKEVEPSVCPLVTATTYEINVKHENSHPKTLESTVHNELDFASVEGLLSRQPNGPLESHCNSCSLVTLAALQKDSTPECSQLYQMSSEFNEVTYTTSCGNNLLCDQCRELPVETESDVDISTKLITLQKESNHNQIQGPTYHKGHLIERFLAFLKKNKAFITEKLQKSKCKNIIHPFVNNFVSGRPVQDSEEVGENDKESGWKVLCGDVFRPPGKGMLLSVFVGSGTQIIVMALCTLCVACLGFPSLASTAALINFAVVSWVLLGALAGYVTVRFHMHFGGDSWITSAFLTSFLCPGVVFVDFFLMDVVLRSEESSGAITSSTLLTVLGLWFFISAPLTFLGAYFGFKMNAIEVPVCTNPVPREIPKQPFYSKPILGIIMGGVLPFLCVSIQLSGFLTSIWFRQSYHSFSILFPVFIMLAITCSACTVILCYFHLCTEDYRWQWRSFLASGCTAVYFLINALYFFLTTLKLQGAASTVLFFGYNLILGFILFLLTGTIGFFACFWFLTKIYTVTNCVKEIDVGAPLI